MGWATAFKRFSGGTRRHSAAAKRPKSTAARQRRFCRVETLESRTLLSVSPSMFGANGAALIWSMQRAASTASPLSAIQHTLVETSNLVTAVDASAADPATTTIVTAPTGQANPSKYGQVIGFYGKVTALDGDANPTGTITFADNGVPMANSTKTLILDTTDPAGLTSISETGYVPTSSTFLPGKHEITVVYAGDGLFAAPTTNTAFEQIVKGPTTTTVAPSPNPSPYGESLTLAAHVSAPLGGNGTPTGTVTFYDGSTTLAAGVPLDSSLNATFSTSTLPAGPHTFRAVFSSADNNYTDISSDTNSTAPTTAATISGTTDLQIANAVVWGSTKPGGTGTFTIIVTNAGPVPVTGVMVQDTFPSNLSGISYTAAPSGGATGYTATGSGNVNDTVFLPVGASITYIVHATIGLTATGSVSDTALLTLPTGVSDPDPSNNSSTTAAQAIAPLSVDLQVTNTANWTTAKPGNSGTFTIVVTNAGPDPVTGVPVTDTFPATLTGVTYSATQSGGASGFTSGSGTINDTVNLPAGSSIIYTVHATIAAGATGSISDTATATVPAWATDANSGNNSGTAAVALTPLSADLQVSMSSSWATNDPDSTGSYTITVTNAGPDGVTGAHFMATFPTTLTNVAYTTDWTGTASGFDPSGSGNSIDNMLNLASGSSVTYSVTAAIDAAAQTGDDLTSTASVTAPSGVTDPPGNNSVSKPQTVGVLEADLAITNIASFGTSTPGSIGTYTIVITNNGPNDVTGATVSDNFPNSLTDVSYFTYGDPGTSGFTSSGNGNVHDTTVVIPVGASVTYVVNATIADGTSGQVTDTATVTEPDNVTDSVQGNNAAVATVTVRDNATDTTVTAAPADSAAPGQAVTFTATVTAGAGTPTGSVTFLDGTTVLNTVSLNGSGMAAYTTSALAAGSHDITAQYSGDGSFASSDYTLTSYSIEQLDSTTTLASSWNPAAPGDPVTFTAHVAGPAGSSLTPTGQVTFLEDGTTLGVGTLSGGVATYTISTLTLGSHTLTAEYGGDTTFLSSTSDALTQGVNPAAIVTLVGPSGTITYPQSVTFSATVAAASGSDTPTGSVTFKDGSTVLGTPQALDDNGMATFTATTLGAGTHAITATYSGDDNFSMALSNTVNQVIAKAASSTSVGLSPSSSTYGQSVTVTATVTSSAGTPSGTVTFMDGSNTLGTGALSGGIATFTTSTLTGGTHSVTAVYGGDSTFSGSTSTAASQTVNTAATTISIGSTANPATAGQAVVLIASVSTSVSGAAPSGTVTFKEGSTTLGTGTLSSGSASFTTSALAVGTHSITAVYGGDTNYSASTTTTALSQVVQQAPPSNVNMAYLATDPLDSTKQALFVYGTSAVDVILVNPGSSSGSATVTINGVSKGSFQPTGRIIVHGGDGNDTIGVSPNVTTPAWLYAGSGNDVIWGGSGPNVLIGDSGRSELIGGKGRNLLIGGSGDQIMLGGGGDTVMVPGTTDFDANDAALLAIVNEWNSGGDFSARTGNLTSGSGGQNGGYYLNAATVHDNGGPDTLIGGSGMTMMYRGLGDRINMRQGGGTIISMS
jgi:uncharacterized repeat protein (TIGR01451 family)